MPARRCSNCAYNWPIDPEEDYKICPQCLEATSPIGNIRAMPEDEARTLKIEFDFEHFYEQWDESHPADRLSTRGMPEYEPTLPATVEAVA